MMLLGVAATINVMAVDYTAKAKITLEAESGYQCELTLRQADEYGALDGAEMYMEGRKVALYALNGSTKLQIAKAADLSELKLGFMGDASTSYTLTVSAVEGAETLYIWDGSDASFALTEGAVYNFTAAGSAADEARFVVKKAALPSGPEFCFNYNVLKVNGYEGKALIVKSEGGDEKANIASLPATYSLDLSAESGRFIVTLDGVDYQIDANPAVEEVKP